MPDAFIFRFIIQQEDSCQIRLAMFSPPPPHGIANPNLRRNVAMKFPRITNPLFALSLVVVSFAAFAESSKINNGKETAPEWSKADSNRDGFLTKDELVPYRTLGQDFDKIDTNGDNRISQDEYIAWREVGSKRQ
jgi:hypothetical protein